MRNVDHFYGNSQATLKKFFLCGMGKRQHHKYFHSNQEFPRGSGIKPSDCVLLQSLGDTKSEPKIPHTYTNPALNHLPLKNLSPST